MSAIWRTVVDFQTVQKSYQQIVFVEQVSLELLVQQWVVRVVDKQIVLGHVGQQSISQRKLQPELGKPLLAIDNRQIDEVLNEPFVIVEQMPLQIGLQRRAQG